jgi:hypothetical protein
MDIKQLRYFIAIAEEGSLSAALPVLARGASLFHRLAGVARFGLREFLGMVGHHLGEPAQEPTVFSSTVSAPAAPLDSRVRRAHRQMDVMRVAGSNRGKNFSLGRRDHRDRLFGASGLPGIVDEDAFGRLNIRGLFGHRTPYQVLKCRLALIIARCKDAIFFSSYSLSLWFTEHPPFAQKSV